MTVALARAVAGRPSLVQRSPRNFCFHSIASALIFFSVERDVPSGALYHQTRPLR